MAQQELRPPDASFFGSWVGSELQRAVAGEFDHTVMLRMFDGIGEDRGPGLPADSFPQHRLKTVTVEAVTRIVSMRFRSGYGFRVTQRTSWLISSFPSHGDS